MFQLNEVTVDGVALQYFAAGDPAHPCILVLADSTLASAPAISLSSQLAKIYQLVMLPIPFADVVQPANEDIAVDGNVFLPNLIAKFAESVGLAPFVVYATDSLTPIAGQLARQLRRKVVALIVQHDCSKERDVTARWDDFPPARHESGVMAGRAGTRHRCNDVGCRLPAHELGVRLAVPTLVILGDQDVALPVGADGADLFKPASLVVRRFDTSHFPLDAFHCEIAAEVDDFLQRAGIRGRTAKPHTPATLDCRTCAFV